MQHAVCVVRLFKYGNDGMHSGQRADARMNRGSLCGAIFWLLHWEGCDGATTNCPSVRSDQDLTLEVGIVPVPVLVLSVGELGIPLAVRDPTERRVIVKAGVEDLVHYLLRLLSADVPHC